MEKSMYGALWIALLISLLVLLRGIIIAPQGSRVGRRVRA